MEAHSGYDPSLSVHLSRALDEIGLNEKTVWSRRTSALKREALNAIFNSLTGRNTSIIYYIFGSQSDAATTPGLQSDTDTLFCYNNFIVIQDWAEWQPGKVNLLMLQENTAPGYCRLQVLRDDVPLPREDLPDEHYSHDSQRRVLMKNSVLRLHQSGMLHNGPAHTRITAENPGGEDYVSAFQCTSWLPCARLWSCRPRRGHWPPPSLVRQAESDGIFLVGVGHKQSPTPDLEWRISYSKTERMLMYSLNITQVKCYVVLKMLKKCFIGAVVGDSISSYHCKTVLFHAIEDTPADFWREDKLVECVVQCLRLLLTWTNNMFCPHYIVTESNLFAGKITSQNQAVVQRVLQDLIANLIQCLSNITVDQLGQVYQTQLCSPDISSCSAYSPQTMKVVFRSEYCFNTQYYVIKKDVMLSKFTTDTDTLIQFLLQQISQLQSPEGTIRDFHFLKEQVERKAQKFFSLWLGSVMASVSLSTGREITQEAICWLEREDKRDVSSLLKVASVHYSCRCLSRTQEILEQVDSRFYDYHMLSCCNCFDFNHKYTEDFAHLVFTIDERERNSLFADCVKFCPQERHCVPPALRHEFHRAAGDDVAHRDPEGDNWMALAAVDSLPYLRYLQYLTYGALGEHNRQARALQQLDQCLREGDNYQHLETGWNLLGQCWEQENKPESAMSCYRTSLEIRPRNNAANHHIENLRYQAIRDGLEPPKAVQGT